MEPCIRTIATDDDPCLRMVAKDIELNEICTDEIQQLIVDMIVTMKNANGIGLAAPQIRVSKRIIVFFLPPERDENRVGVELTTLINPKIEFLNETLSLEYEGCLSLPNTRGKVNRINEIKYSGYDSSGQYIERLANGWHARVVQHEVDHLNGVLYTDVMPEDETILSVDEWREELRQYEWKEKLRFIKCNEIIEE